MTGVDEEGGHVFEVFNRNLILLKEKAIYSPELGSLFISDPHFGKAAHFRKAGIPIPEILHEEDLMRIKELIERYKPKDIYFLGDLFHSDLNESWFVLEEFSGLFAEINFHLVKGNHDILSDACYRSSLWIIHEEPLVLENLILSHEPLSAIPEGKFNLCGHIHPGIALHGKGRQRLMLPCFFAKPNQMVLPAFGRFTGLASMKCTKTDQAFVITDKNVIPIDLMK
ncbi:ligase-associated DNA damage response endonuclease PdeM [Rhodonellum sp.]|uniref:ligase-associated DNA damage response endonuclease PdeM n=1 Tax=Rhodonellum sp. TaxID=2231180 RepID=UPI00271E1D7C|nr:ligase-associated DNA damage response endonuclease PdeM [Rhodonellum sp.]MDO9554713.1 ligase-associated DNA damage response endonuclease PdeM [Rhodonellum sp.]